MSQFLHHMSSFHTSFDINAVSLDRRNSRGFTNTKGTVEGINIKTPGNIFLFFQPFVFGNGLDNCFDVLLDGPRGGVTQFGGLRTYNANLSADAAWQAVARWAPHPALLIYFSFPKRGEIPNGHFIMCFGTFRNSQLGFEIPNGHFIVCF